MTSPSFVPDFFVFLEVEAAMEIGEHLVQQRLGNHGLARARRGNGGHGSATSARRWRAVARWCELVQRARGHQRGVAILEARARCVAVDTEA